MKGFGIELRLLSEETLELVRGWRNDEQTSRFMQFREQIAPADQLKWFQSLEKAYYFVIYSGAVPVGLIDLKKIDEKNKTAESGLLIGNTDFVGTGIALGASVLLLDFAFGELNLQTVTATISNQNSEAEKYNQLLGFVKKQSVDGQFYRWELEQSDYAQNRKKLVMFLSSTR